MNGKSLEPGLEHSQWFINVSVDCTFADLFSI
jgi:hypothetical protein